MVGFCADENAPQKNELEGFGIRLGKKKPNITVRKKDKGGVFFTHTVTPTHLDKEIVEAICKEYKYASCEVCLHEDATADQLIDCLEGNRVYIPAVRCPLFLLFLCFLFV